MVSEFFPPRISEDTRLFWEACKERRLLAQRCADCGTVRWPAAFLCPECLSENTEMTELSPYGTVYSYVVFRRPFDASLAEKLPYVVAAVDMDGGITLLSNIVGCDPAQIRCGSRVRLRWAESEAYTRPVFELIVRPGPDV